MLFFTHLSQTCLRVCVFPHAAQSHFWMRLLFGPVFHGQEPQVATSTADVERRRAEARRSFREAEVAVEMK